MSTATLSTSFVTQMMILALVAVTRAIQVCVKMAKVSVLHPINWSTNYSANTEF